MMLPERVLPSNAPPLLQDGLHSARRVLQERSGNRQHTHFACVGGYEPDFSVPSFNENSYFPQHQHQNQQQQRQQQLSQQLHHPRPQHRKHWKYGLQRNGFNGYALLDHPDTQAEAEYLYRRFKQSEAYVKYRTRQTKDDKGNDDQKWPEHLEKAFFRALVTWTPMGRRKEWWKEKQRGRNELIADCIEELTGEQRTRKQVSSHIQVLKPFVESDPYIMRYLSKEDLSQRGRHTNGVTYGAGRRTSSYPVTALPYAARAAIPSMATSKNSYGVSKLKQDPDVIEPVEFQMFIQQKHAASESDEDAPPPRRLHTYTRSVNNPLEPDLHLQDWQKISRDFPLLATLNGQGKLNCNVIVAAASLAFPTNTFKAPDGTTIPGVELGISFLCTSRHFSPTMKNAQVRCHNTFYENGAIVGEPQRSDVRFGTSERPKCSHMADTQVKFGSTFWAKTLGQMANRLLSPSKDWSEGVAAHIRSITVLQEMFIVSNGQHDRLLVIHWTFRHSTRAEGGASWRKLTLPSTALQYPKLDESVKHGNYTPVARQESFLDWDSQFVDLAGTQPQKQHLFPALLSPFEYDRSSGSALSSATWPTSVIEGGFVAPEHGDLDFSTDNTFDFNAGNINIAYDHSINFDNFDSSAFDFDTTANFAADPVLETYSHTWVVPSASAAFDSQPHNAVEEANLLATQHDFDTQATTYNGSFDTRYSQHPYQATSDQQGHTASTPDQQAYGGAGQDIDIINSKEEDPLAALANASFLATASGEKTGTGF